MMIRDSNAEWFDAAHAVGDPEQLFSEACGWKRVEVTSDYSVWVEGPDRGRWLTLEEIATVQARIDARAAR